MKTKTSLLKLAKNLGSVDLLFDQFSSEFLKKNGLDPRENVRCRLRMLDSIEKMRKLLTSNKEAELNCDSLLDDIDFHR